MHDMYDNQGLPVLLIVVVIILLFTYCRLTVGENLSSQSHSASFSQHTEKAGE